MKTATAHSRRLATLCLGVVIAAGTTASNTGLRAEEKTTPTRERVGIYDSRVVAYAYFWGEAGTHKRNELIEAAKAAKASGDAEKIKQTNDAVAALQAQNHLQLFSTAPVDDVLAAIDTKLPAILQQAGVSRLVLKWDEEALQKLGDAERVDVTDVLAAALLTPNDKQRSVIASLKSQKPLPLAEARKLLAEGKL